MAPAVEMISPSPHRDGQQLVLSDPPSRPLSHAEGSTQFVDPDNRRSDNNNGRPGLTPPSQPSELSAMPTVRFDALEGLIPDSQIMNLRLLVSHHELQRQKVMGSASYLNILRDETFDLREAMTSHLGRVDRGISDTVQHLNDGDNLIRALSNAFDRPIGVEGPTASAATAPERLPYRQSPVVESGVNDIVMQDAVVNDGARSNSPGASDETPSDVTEGAQPQSGNLNIIENNPVTRPSAEPLPNTILEAMNREFPPRRDNESSEQFENRYLAHQRRINNTQQSWARNVYDIPRPEVPASTRPGYQPTGTAASATPVVRPRIAPIHNRIHRDIPLPGRYKNPTIAALAAKSYNVQFDASDPDRNEDSESRQESGYPEGPTGISAYRVSHGPPNNGLWNAEQYHYTVMLKRIKKLIHWKVGMPITAPPGAKQPKLSEPAKYAGSRNHDAFIQWLNQFLNWLRSHYYCGDEADFSRLNFLGNYVEGIAADWYAADVDNPDKMSVEPMKFVDAVCMMHRRFVRTATANNAVTQYDRVEYSPSEGVEGFYYKLDKMASRMIERPSDYSFRLRLFEGLPFWIHDALLKRNILPEFCTLEDIRENARQIEELSTRERGSYHAAATSALRRTEQNNPPRPHSAPNNVGPSRSGQTRGMGSTRPNTFRSQGERNPQSTSNVRFAPRSSGYANRTSTVPTGPRNNFNRPAGDPASNSGSKPPRGDQNTKDSSSVECYRCHQIGHISSNPICPKHPSKQGRTRLNAQRLIEDEDVIDEEGQDELNGHEHEAEEERNSWGGSQYDPDNNFEEVVDHQEEEEEGPLPEDDEDQEDEVRMSSMRTLHMFAMRRIVNEEEVQGLSDEASHQDTTPAQGTSSVADAPRTGASDSQPQENNIQSTSYTLNGHLFDGDDDIVDPVYIEWRGPNIHRVGPNDGWDEVIRLNPEIPCRICGRCRPVLNRAIFVGLHDRCQYFYMTLTCRTPIERSRALADISDDESDFEVSRFFAGRIIDDNVEDIVASIINDADDDGVESDDSLPELIEIPPDSPATNMIGGIQGGLDRRIPEFVRDNGDPIDHWYVDDPAPNVARAEPTINGVGEGSDSDFTDDSDVDDWYYPATSMDLFTNDTVNYINRQIADERQFFRDNVTCRECGECTPRIVADYRPSRRPPITRVLRAVCLNSQTPFELRRGLSEILVEGSLPVTTRAENTSRPASPAEAGSSQNNGARLHAMRTVYSSNVRRNTPFGTAQPKRSRKLQATLSAEIEINGVKALTLFDTGSTTDSVTPEFAFATKANTFKLDEQVILQLGCVGSRSKISYGTRVPIGIGHIKDEVYFDLVNIDRYDCIIGTPFMNEHGVCLDFGTRTIRMNGQEIQAMTFDEEQLHVDKKKQLRSYRQGRPPPRETAPLKRRVVEGPLPSTSH